MYNRWRRRRLGWPYARDKILEDLISARVLGENILCSEHEIRVKNARVCVCVRVSVTRTYTFSIFIIICKLGKNK